MAAQIKRWGHPKPLKLEKREESGGSNFLSLQSVMTRSVQAAHRENRGSVGPFGAIAGLLIVGGDGELFPDLEKYFKIFRELDWIVAKLIRGLRLIKGPVSVDRANSELLL